MNNIRALSFLAVMLTISSFNLLASEIEPNVQYRGETTLKSSEYGISFVLPSGWVGVFPTDGEFFIMKNQEFEGYIFAGIREMTIEEAKQTMGEEIALGDGIIFHPKNKVLLRGSILEAEYKVNGSQNPLVGNIKTVVGKYGCGIFFIAASQAKDVAKFKNSLNKISSSLSLSKPKGSRPAPKSKGSSPWFEQLNGRKLSHFFTRSGYTEEDYIWLCQNGYFYKSFNSGGFGGGASGAFQSKNAGTWSVSGNLDNGLLLLSYNDGSTLRYTLTHDGTKLFLDGKRYFRESNNCN